MFDQIRQSLRDVMARAAPPEERRAVFAAMKDTIVHARLGVEDLRGSVAQTRSRLAHEQGELATVQRRKGLAAGIGDQETVAVAEQFERHHQERVDVLARKLAAQEGELALAERELAEMTAELKRAVAGAPPTPAGAGADPGGAGPGAGGATDPLDDGREPLGEEIERLSRQQRRAAADAEAESRLAELKRRMGK